jgi:tetratricopeptide (TPR) repeat protein
LLTLVTDLAEMGRKRKLTEFDNVIDSVKRDATDEKTLVACIRLALYVGRFEDAQLLGSHAINQCPRSAALRSYRGVACAELQNFESAIVDFERSLQLDAGFQNGFTWYRLAVVQSTKGNNRAAFASIGEALKCQRDSDRLAFYAQLLVEDGQMDKAMKRAKEAVELDPKHLYSRLVLGFIFACRGNNRRADAEFQHALKINNDELTRRAVDVARDNAIRYHRIIGSSKPVSDQ